MNKMITDSILETAALRLEFDRATGGLSAITNKLTGETYAVASDAFAIETTAFRRTQAEMRQVAWSVTADSVTARYADADLTVDVVYTLRKAGHFVEKRLGVTPKQDCGVRKVVVSEADYAVDGLLVLLSYRYQKNVTFFARTLAGGLFCGMELPFDTSHADGDSITLSCRPNLKIKAGASLAVEPAYWGVYRRGENDNLTDGELLAGHQYQDIPMPSESEALLAMVSEVLGPPRHGPTAVLLPSCCGGWSCFKPESAWTRDATHAAVYRSIYDFAAECGIDRVQDILPWGGETAKLNALAGDQPFRHDAWVKELHEYARGKGLSQNLWSTFANTEPWSPDGRSFRGDRPDWQIEPVVADATFSRPPYSTDNRIFAHPANCMGSNEYRDWLTAFFLDVMEAEGFEGFSIDGDFFGTGGWFTSTNYAVRCLAEHHAHLPGDAQYACQRALAELFAAVRDRFPKAFLWLMRPMMDLGVWTYRNGDAVFTLDECGKVLNLTGIPDQPANVTFGDKIRAWSRLRRQRHFCPHYLDQVSLFAGQDGAGNNAPWIGEKLDYVMLSAISAAPNQCFLCGHVEAIPAADRAIIRRWLDWSRRNADCLLARRDLGGAPGVGRVDGSIHVRDGQGFILLFNPNPEPLDAEIRLDPGRFDMRGEEPLAVSQEYPAGERRETCRPGATVCWDVPPLSAMVLRVTPQKMLNNHDLTIKETES